MIEKNNQPSQDEIAALDALNYDLSLVIGGFFKNSSIQGCGKFQIITNSLIAALISTNSTHLLEHGASIEEAKSYINDCCDLIKYEFIHKIEKGMEAKKNTAGDSSRLPEGIKKILETFIIPIIKKDKP